MNCGWVDHADQCGGNVNDACDIPLPPWVLAVGKSNRLSLLPSLWRFLSCSAVSVCTVAVSLNPPEVLLVLHTADIFYTDQNGHRDQEYLSLGVDHQPLFGGRTAVQLYSDMLHAFASNFSTQLGKTITLLEVGMGPAGEMRYPSYQLSEWTFCGVGAFQCYDKYMLQSLQNAASKAGHPGDTLLPHLWVFISCPSY